MRFFACSLVALGLCSALFSSSKLSAETEVSIGFGFNFPLYAMGHRHYGPQMRHHGYNHWNRHREYAYRDRGHFGHRDEDRRNDRRDNEQRDNSHSGRRGR